jgi:hypothetical protein
MGSKVTDPFEGNKPLKFENQKQTGVDVSGREDHRSYFETAWYLTIGAITFESEKLQTEQTKILRMSDKPQTLLHPQRRSFSGCDGTRGIGIEKDHIAEDVYKSL